MSEDDEEPAEVIEMSDKARGEKRREERAVDQAAKEVAEYRERFKQIEEERRKYVKENADLIRRVVNRVPPEERPARVASLDQAIMMQRIEVIVAAITQDDEVSRLAFELVYEQTVNKFLVSAEEESRGASGLVVPSGSGRSPSPAPRSAAQSLETSDDGAV